MWDNATIMMLVEGTFVTLYMTLVSTFMGYVLGLPMGIALCRCRQGDPEADCRQECQSIEHVPFRSADAYAAQL